MKSYSKHLVFLIFLVISFSVSLWIGEDLVSWPLLIIMSLTSPIFWFVLLLSLLSLLYFGQRRNKLLHYFIYLMLVVAFVIPGWLIGQKISQSAYNNCVKNGDQIRKILNEFHKNTGQYPLDLAELNDIDIPGDRFFRENIIEYTSDGKSYSMIFGDWLVVHEATDKSEFNVRK